MLTERARRSNARVVFLQPSEGRGGGIERYCDALKTYFRLSGPAVERVALLHPGELPTLRTKLRFLLRAWRMLSRCSGDVSAVFICHPGLALSLAPVLWLRGVQPAEAQVLFYGQDIWSLSTSARLFLRRAQWRLLTISSFSAGALTPIGAAAVLPPLVPPQWRAQLLTGQPRDTQSDEGLQLLTAFRLADADDKGLLPLLHAVDRIRDDGISVSLTVAGSGDLPPTLAEEVHRRKQWVSVVSGPTDCDLVNLYAAADLFVLATRLRVRPPYSGEGLGLVLLEAQLAGLPVVAPAFGGGESAYVHGFTGIRPVDESADALADAIRSLSADRQILKQFSDQARRWSAQATDPAIVAERIRDVLAQAIGSR